MPAKLSDLSESTTLSMSDLLYATVGGISKKIKPGVLARLIKQEQRIINGSFAIWQRGTSTSAVGYGAADRWRNDFTGGAVTQSRQAVPLGTLFGLNSPEFFLRQSVSGQSLASHFAQTQQRIEGVRNFSGQTVTVLGWAKRNSGAGNLGINFSQNFGTGGSPSAQVEVNGQVVTLGASWAPFALTFAIPSISGKVLGTNLNDYLALNLWTSAGADFATRAGSIGIQTADIDVWGLHVMPGSFDSSVTELFQAPDADSEMHRCKRYYNRITGGVNSRFGVGHNSLTTAAICTIPFPVEMRTAPTALEQSGTAAHYDVQHANTQTVCSAVPTFLAANVDCATVTLTVAAGLTAGQGSNGRFANTAGYLAWSAEL